MATTTEAKTEAIKEYMQTAEDSTNLALEDLEQAHRILAGIKAGLTDHDRLGIIREARQLRQLAAFISQRADDLEGAALF